MSAGGSQQLRTFRRAMRDGYDINYAATLAGIGIGEARLHAADDAKNPPPPEAFEPLSTPPALSCAPEVQPQENDMARTARKAPDNNGGEVPTKDFALAVKLYREDIKGAANKVGEHAQEMSTAYKAIKKNAHIQPAAAKLAFKLLETEDAKRDDFLRCLNGLLAELKIGLEPDLVDQMQGGDNKGPAPVQSNARPRPQLVTVPPSDGTETDLADAGEKVAQEKAKPKRAAAKAAAGTGLAAIQAMNAAARGGDDEEDGED